MVGAERFDERSLVGRFVQLRRLELERERAQRAVVSLGERRGHRGIEAAAEIRAHGNVRPHADAGGIGKQRFDLLARLGLAQPGAFATGREAQRPVGLDPHRAAFRDQLVAGRQLMDAFERRARRKWRPEGEALVERQRIELGLQAGIEEERFDFGGENQHAVVDRVVERPHTHAVARHHQALAAPIPDGVGEIAVERLHARGPVLRIGVQDGFGVAAGAELPAARDQLGRQLDVVEDLAVERDPDIAVGRGERLLAAREVDDREASVAERRALVEVDAGCIGPAMAHGLDHALEHGARRQRARLEGDEAGDATHGKPKVRGFVRL